VWCVGAVVFQKAEKRIQDMTYFEALYFCYVSLLTIGYGDFSPKSNAGKPFFVVWSLVAIPTMTILVSDMGKTVISAYNRGTFTLADWTVLPKAGVWADFLNSHPKLRDWLERKTKERQEKKRLERGFEVQNPDEENNSADHDSIGRGGSALNLEKIASEPLELTEHDLARRLALAIKKTANDLHSPHDKKYSYEEWVEFTRLIRFSKLTEEEVEEAEDDEGLVEWDWIGEDSPMLADVSESEWVLDRLCESLNRYTRKQARYKRPKVVTSFVSSPFLRIYNIEANTLQLEGDEGPDSAISMSSPKSPKTPAHRHGPLPSYPSQFGARFPRPVASGASGLGMSNWDFHDKPPARGRNLASSSSKESGESSGSGTTVDKNDKNGD